MTQAPPPEVPIALGALRVDGQRECQLASGWEVASLPPGAAADPAAAASACDWRGVARVGPMAAIDDRIEPAALDRFDHWYRCRLRAADAGGVRALLCFDGLATIADAWLDGRPLLHAEDMFTSHAVDVTGGVRDGSELVLRFAALAPRLRERRPRGRWPTRLVAERNLRFERTALLGYLPAWCPPAKVAGPWRPVRLVAQERVAVERARVVPHLCDGAARLSVRLQCRWLGAGAAATAPLRASLAVGGASTPLRCERGAGGAFVVSGAWEGRGVEPWWPHTHGAPALHAAQVVLEAGGAPLAIGLGDVGFRSVGLADGDLDAFRLAWNGEPLFARGACWTPLDPLRLHAPVEALRAALLQVRDAGMNMLRIGGTGVYESDDFHRLCDELGILVWQDFAFASFDYPADDAFLARCRREAEQQLERTAGRCSLAVACGGSEVQQQAAMMGRPPAEWTHPLFDAVLPAACAEQRPDLVYVPSSPCRGDLPFHVAQGPSHYFGVGAYRRPLDDARLAGVRFASECLAFANVPEAASLEAWFGEAAPHMHDPRWKAGVPRDPGAGWDFADVTDHYVAACFGVDPAALRAADPGRYLALCRVATGETMAAVQRRWRARGSGCSGALVWWLRDLVPGAGWGVVDAAGAPKAAYHFLARAWAPLAVWLVDDGVDGARVFVANDAPRARRGVLSVALVRRDGRVAERAETEVEVAPRSERSWNVEALLGAFCDATWAYRFGPPGHDAVVAHFAPHGEDVCVAPAFLFPAGLASAAAADAGLDARAEPLGGGHFSVTVRAERLARFVAVEAPGFRASDAYFCVAPGIPHRLRLAPLAGEKPLVAELRPLGAPNATPVRVTQ
ncbi:MAG: beta-mannosidase [Proteobacteria bacterium]|nr:MAG: beta-mannosidase [Pseudomonadota bacterium]